MSQASIWAIPALHDNYIWAVQRNSSIVVVDPGEADPVLSAIDDRHLHLSAILITHHHWDHVNGVAGILEAHDVPVYGPSLALKTVPQIRHGLSDGDEITLPDIGLSLQAISVPGHTLDHTVYYGNLDAQPVVFSGDTLFSAGCGRLFEGDPPTMHASLQRLAALPPETRVYCGHEYTQANLNFALAVEPANQQILAYRKKVDRLREENKPSLPSTIGLELEINPFMRCHLDSLHEAAQTYSQQNIKDDVATFAAIRRWKDSF